MTFGKVEDFMDCVWITLMQRSLGKYPWTVDLENMATAGTSRNSAHLRHFTFLEEERRLAELMLEHQDEYFNQFEMADVLGDHQFDPESGTDPFLHITFHTIVENQLEAKDPIEVYQFYNSMRKKKVSHHDTIHLIGAILAPSVVTPCREEPLAWSNTSRC